MGALDDPDPGNPIAVEVARLIEGYTETFLAHVDRLGYIPDSFLRVKPQTAIEAVAMRLTTEAIQDELASYIYTPPRCQQREQRYANGTFHKG
jgi:hypothetical protein